MSNDGCNADEGVLMEQINEDDVIKDDDDTKGRELVLPATIQPNCVFCSVGRFLSNLICPTDSMSKKMPAPMRISIGAGRLNSLSARLMFLGILQLDVLIRL